MVAASSREREARSLGGMMGMDEHFYAKKPAGMTKGEHAAPAG
jgi:hypothetical protein